MSDIDKMRDEAWEKYQEEHYDYLSLSPHHLFNTGWEAFRRLLCDNAVDTEDWKGMLEGRDKEIAELKANENLQLDKFITLHGSECDRLTKELAARDKEIADLNNWLRLARQHLVDAVRYLREGNEVK